MKDRELFLEALQKVFPEFAEAFRKVFEAAKNAFGAMDVVDIYIPRRKICYQKRAAYAPINQTRFCDFKRWQKANIRSRLKSRDRKRNGDEVS